MSKKLNSILLVDDDEATNFLNSEVIKEFHCANHIHVSMNGHDALDFIAARGPYVVNGTTYPYPDLILLDLNMPEMSGWEFLEEYKRLQAARKKEIPVIILTTSPNPADKEKAAAFREIWAYKQKPLSEEMLKEILCTVA